MKTARAKPVKSAADLQLFLRIKHPSLDPAEISRALAIEPEQTIAAGADVSSTGVRRLHSESYWIAKLPTTSITELAERYRWNSMNEVAPVLSKEDVVAMMGATGHDLRIMFLLKQIEKHREFFERINREGGSVTLIADREEAGQPIALKLALKKLVELGIALEVD